MAYSITPRERREEEDSCENHPVSDFDKDHTNSFVYYLMNSTPEGEEFKKIHSRDSEGEA